MNHSECQFADFDSNSNFSGWIATTSLADVLYIYLSIHLPSSTYLSLSEKMSIYNLSFYISISSSLNFALNPTYYYPTSHVSHFSPIGIQYRINWDQLWRELWGMERMWWKVLWCLCRTTEHLLRVVPFEIPLMASYRGLYWLVYWRLWRMN